MATENNLNSHNVHQEEKEDNLHDLDQGGLLRGFDNSSGAARSVVQFCKKALDNSFINNLDVTLTPQDGRWC